MLTACREMPWVRALRAVALVVAIVLGVEWTAPLGGYAQPNTEPASTPSASVGTQDLPPMQEAEVIPMSFYKKWWFWTIVVVLVAGGTFIGFKGGPNAKGSSHP